MQKKSSLSIVATVLVVIALLGGGFGIMKKMAASRAAPQKTDRVVKGALVEVQRATKSSRQVRVSSAGTVQPGREITITPQVSGTVVAVSPRLKAGGYFNKDEVMLQIEDIDYRLAIASAKAALAKTEFELASIENKARIARMEWERMKRKGNEEPSSLVLYEPQLKDAEASRASALAGLKQAKINLERTVVKAPFNGVVRSEQVDEGQYVRAGAGIGSLLGTDAAEIIVPVRLEELVWLDAPKIGASTPGSEATLTLRINGSRFEWHGRIVRTLGDVDPKGRMARVVVAVDDPYGIEEGPESGRPALAMGLFVEVQFVGKTIPEAVVIPRRAFRDNSTVWVMDGDEKLKIKNVTVIRLERDDVLIGSGIEEGDPVILTNLSGVADGMKLRPMGPEDET